MKTEQDYIKAAVELATGWQMSNHGTWIECLEWSSLSCNIALIPQYVLDALAAQLERQYAELNKGRRLSSFKIGTPAITRIQTLVEAIQNGDD